MTLEQIEQAIYEHYRFFSQVAPKTRVREEGRLAQLWRAFDMHVGVEVD